MKSLLTAAGTAVFTSCMSLSAAFAAGRGNGNGGWGNGNGNSGGNGWDNGVGNPHGVPEIDVSAGLLAVAAVAAALVLAWEVTRRRRA